MAELERMPGMGGDTLPTTQDDQTPQGWEGQQITPEALPTDPFADWPEVLVTPSDIAEIGEATLNQPGKSVITSTDRRYAKAAASGPLIPTQS